MWCRGDVRREPTLKPTACVRDARHHTYNNITHWHCLAFYRFGRFENLDARTELPRKNVMVLVKLLYTHLRRPGGTSLRRPAAVRAARHRQEAGRSVGQMEAHEWLQYAEWAKARSWPEDELVQASGAFRHVVHRNLTIAECRARDRATEKWRTLGRKLRGRAIKALAAESWVRKAREELEAARRRARLHAQRSSTDVALQVYLLQKPERDRQATLEEERCMLERVHASRKALVQVERARTRAIYQSDRKSVV